MVYYHLLGYIKIYFPAQLYILEEKNNERNLMQLGELK